MTRHDNCFCFLESDKASLALQGHAFVYQHLLAVIFLDLELEKAFCTKSKTAQGIESHGYDKNCGYSNRLDISRQGCITKSFIYPQPISG
jgi:hypothetical protein